ncbi:DNA transformation protein [Breznakia sp. PF5-3]|uniref:TfoX/Sxy family DNA transformation protein n=1 Tax=unclassified Breznakia TaxID=2623764 RepID=UPI0024049ADC|nr:MULTISPECIES: TfoX/Sxy family DNA transformation protein [unclassified Breznakia]MDF9823662.1 DNA transformation protein [Breznakia sp. PM6-1]MDF9834460.1 DNA transformation protein [Breznakia sp. PF5-3]
MNDLLALPNVGKVLAQNLLAAGITTPEQLYTEGSMNAFLKIRENADPDACIRVLYGLQGAIEGIKDTNLSYLTKNELKHFFYSLNKK